MKRVLHFLTKNTENDQTWELFGIALTNIKTWALEDKAHEYEGFVDHIKQLQRPIIASVRLFAYKHEDAEPKLIFLHTL